MKYKCPHCNVDLKIDDTVDIDVNENYVNCKIVGYCPECDRLYSWYDHYKYEKSFDFGLTI